MADRDRKPMPWDGQVRPVDLDAIPPEIAAYARDYLASGTYARDAERAARKAARLERLHRDAPLRFGLTEGPLPEGASAVVVRMAEGSTRRLIVYSLSSLTDELLAISMHALREDEQAVPQVSGPRLVYVWADQRVLAPGVDKQMRYEIGQSARGDAALLLRGIVTGNVQVPSIGRVQLVEDRP